MFRVGSFEEEMASLKRGYENGTFGYDASRGHFDAVACAHFKDTRREQTYGIYVIRQQETREALYIGKGGTVRAQGQFKGQGLYKRLINVKRSDESANAWFLRLSHEKGPLEIEYILLLPTPASPALVEAALLQAYLNEYGRLPSLNRSL